MEKELEVARASHIDGKYSLGIASNQSLRKAFAVIGINTAFSNKKRREAVRASWMPTGLIALLMHIYFSLPIFQCLNILVSMIIVQFDLKHYYTHALWQFKLF